MSAVDRVKLKEEAVHLVAEFGINAIDYLLPR